MNYRKSKTALRKIRQNIFSYGDGREDQAARVIDYLKARVKRDDMLAPLGPYSGLSRAELAHTGTCEPDWF